MPSRWRWCCWHLLSACILDNYWIVILPTAWECLPSAQPHLTALVWILLSVLSHLHLPHAFFCPPSQNGSSKCKDIDIGSTYANRWGTQSPPSAPPCHSYLPSHCPTKGTAVWTPSKSGLCKKYSINKLDFMLLFSCWFFKKIKVMFAIQVCNFPGHIWFYMNCPVYFYVSYIALIPPTLCCCKFEYVKQS